MGVSSFQREYGGVVWTDHALERLKSRKIYQSDALGVIKNPEKTYPGKGGETTKLIKSVNGRRVHLVASENEQGQLVVVSVWVRGEEDKLGLLERVAGWLLDKFVEGVVVMKSKFQVSNPRH